MYIDKFELENWLNPLEPQARHMLGSSTCRPVTIHEMLELMNTNPDDFFHQVDATSLHYGYFEGMPRLKEAIAGLFTNVVTSDMVITTHGGTGANSLMCYTLTEPGRNVVVVAPSYQQFVSIPAALGAEVRECVCDETTGYALDMDTLRTLVDANTSAIFLTSPSNPTGYALDRDELLELVDIARGVDAYVVCDEIYRGLDEDYMPSICDVYEKGVSTGGSSKVFSSAGARVGWIVTRDTSLIPTIKNFRSYNSICEGPINELVVALILEHRDVFLARSRKICRDGRAALDAWIAGEPHYHVVCGSHGSTSFLTYDFDMPAKAYAEDEMAQTGTLVCHGMCFGVEHAFRVGYGFGDLDYFKAGLEGISRYARILEERGVALLES